MEKPFYFLIAIHFHQPVGNFDSVIERALLRCYQPFLDTIAEFPDIKFNLHYSGCLLEWFKQHRPGMLDKIKKLVRAKQIELLGGGFYEPILSAIPPEDSLGQLKMHSKFLKQEFGVDISGAWLPERVWEPHLAEILHRAGVKYTIVDDTHLRYSGLSQEQLYGYYITEENGRCLSIFGSDKTLRYSIPFHSPQESLAYLLKVRQQYKRDCVLYGDDGEKFGEWPGTSLWVYEKKWLYNFLKLITDNSAWLKTRKISDYMEKERPQGRVYIPAASYQEMSEWALPAESCRRFEDILEELKNQDRLERYLDFIRGGFWRNFLVKYPEANQMHKRMLLVSERLHSLEKAVRPRTGKTGRMKRRMLSQARRELFRSQCNCAYWHGVFGGIYLYHLRQAVYEHLISAERILDGLEYKKQLRTKISPMDFDCDGREEFIVTTPASGFIIAPGEGGTLTEWDIKPRALNIVNTVSRRKEAYHRRLKDKLLTVNAKPAPSTIHDAHFSNQGVVSRQLCYDRHRRVLFIDHFFGDEMTLEQACANLYQEQGDFTDNRYSLLKVKAGLRPGLEIERKGTVNRQPLRLVKRFSFYPEEQRLRVDYRLINLASRPLRLNFSPELNFSLTRDDINKEYGRIDSLSLSDEVQNLKVELDFSPSPRKVFRYRLCTVSQSERDIEENYQASCILPVFRVRLAKGQARTVSIEVRAG